MRINLVLKTTPLNFITIPKFQPSDNWTEAEGWLENILPYSNGVGILKTFGEKKRTIKNFHPFL